MSKHKIKINQKNKTLKSPFVKLIQFIRTQKLYYSIR